MLMNWYPGHTIEKLNTANKISKIAKLFKRAKFWPK